MRQERSESARERRMALYKSDQQQQQQQKLTDTTTGDGTWLLFYGIASKGRKRAGLGPNDRDPQARISEQEEDVYRFLQPSGACGS